ncbi:MAG TPA: DUF6174 domain-containing protein [Gemmatimonadales bacterium]|nr:DUF6174 domain-containing protein [Gemmatimonadales bacterium]
MRWYAVPMLLAVTTTCGTPVSPSGLWQLAEAEARWAARGYADYAIEAREGCFCPPALNEWSRVEVVDGLVDRVTVVATGTDVPDEDRRLFPTVESLFDVIRRGNDQDWIKEVTVEFDPELGFPTRVVLRPQDGIVDGGAAFYMRNATALSGVPAEADWRRNLIGTWAIEFRLDSVLGSTGWKQGSLETTTGTFQVLDPATDPWGEFVVRSSIDVDFEPMLERPMSCFDPRPVSTVIEGAEDDVRLSFTPHAADCGFSAHGAFAGDSIIGSWSETSFIGPVAKGRFRMRR